MEVFADRAEAGRQLASALGARRGHGEGASAVVVGIARGGVVVAAEVARALGLPLDVVVVRKLGATGRAEYAVGAIADGVRHIAADAVRWAGMTDADLARVERAERAELDRRTRLFDATASDLTGGTAIVVDDGVATGASAVAACRALRRRHPARIVLAVPVAPRAWEPDPAAVDEYVCLHRAADFRAVGQFYDDFTQTSDDEVVRLLRDAAAD